MKQPPGNSGPACPYEPIIPLPCDNVYLDGLRGSEFGDVIFRNAEKINILPYIYLDSVEYNVTGDMNLDSLSNISFYNCCKAISVLDKLSRTPTLEWERIDNKLVAVAISEQRIQLTFNGHSIKNTGDIVWVWHSGIVGTGAQVGNKMRVHYEEGLGVNENGDIIEGQSPVPLELNRGYVWFVWAWNDEGTKIVRSSCEQPFIVEGIIEPIIVSTGKQINGLWILSQAKDQQVGKNITADFFIQNIFFDYDFDCDNRIETTTFEIISNEGTYIDGFASFDSSKISLADSIQFSNVILKCDTLNSIVTIVGETDSVSVWAEFLKL